MSKLTQTLIPAILSAAVISSANADRIFPPSHLSAEASFNEPEVSEGNFTRPWYEETNLAQVEALKAEETIEPSPYVSQYYFVLARSYANDLAQELERLKRVNTAIAENEPGDADKDS